MIDESVTFVETVSISDSIQSAPKNRKRKRIISRKSNEIVSSQDRHTDESVSSIESCGIVRNIKMKKFLKKKSKNPVTENFKSQENNVTGQCNFSFNNNSQEKLMEGETSISKINDKEDDTIDFDFSDGSDIDLKLSLKKRKKIKLPNRRPLKEGEHPESKEQKSGIIYLQTVPPNFTVSRMREEMSKYGEIGRIFLQREKQKSGRKHGRRYVEGWVEFKRKSIAKQVAKYLNAMPVGGKRRSMARETLWTMKYLSGFKWYHLNEQLNYEQKLEKMRMHAEISQAKKQASFFAEQVEKGKQLKKLEEKVLKKGGVWDKFQRQIEQRSVIKKKRKSHENQYTGDDLMKMIFAG